MIDVEEIIEFWYAESTRKRWFNSTAEFDQSLATKYSDVWQQALDGQYDDSMQSASGCLALCILLDQIPRNIFRGDAKAYASDEKARAVCKHAIETGLNKALTADQSRFLYMPLMHSEALADQDLSIQMFAEAGLAQQSEFAHHHRGIIEKFGRFPHRNEKLGRISSKEEIAYLRSKSAFKG